MEVEHTHTHLEERAQAGVKVMVVGRWLRDRGGSRGWEPGHLYSQKEGRCWAQAILFAKTV